MDKKSKYIEENKEGMASEPAVSCRSGMGHVQMNFDVPRSFNEQSFRLLMMVYAQSIIAQPAMKSLMEKLDALLNLPHDWDIYGTPAPSANTIIIAKTLIARFPVTVLNSTDVEPSEWGGISIRVSTDRGVTFSIRILDSGITWYMKHGRSPEFHEEEACTEQVCQTIVNTLSKVA